MRFAIDADGTRLPAAPEARGYCPGCGAPLIAKCGSIMAWHWAHIASADCDPWAEPDTAWHLGWQDLVIREQREIVIGPHRADIVTADGTVVELQHSNISEAEITERETHYGRMAWIFDAMEPYRFERLLIRPRDGYVTFRWKHPRKSIDACRRTVFLDLGNGSLIQVKKIDLESPCGGWGHIVSTERIISWIRGPFAAAMKPQDARLEHPLHGREVVCETNPPHEFGPILSGVTARCTQCGHETKAYTRRRCLTLMYEECPRGERNFYVAGGHG